MKTILTFSFLFLALGACTVRELAESPEAAADVMLIAEGRSVAVAHCSACHALDGAAESPNSAAPPMTQLLARYDADSLANDLIEGIRVGHDEMPEFSFPVTAADALVAYLKSVRE